MHRREAQHVEVGPAPRLVRPRRRRRPGVAAARATAAPAHCSSGDRSAGFAGVRFVRSNGSRPVEQLVEDHAERVDVGVKPTRSPRICSGAA